MEESNAMLAIRGVAQQIAPDVVKADLTVDRPLIRYGDYVTIDARFTLPDKLPATNLATTIQMKSANGAWRNIHQSITDSDGRVKINSLLGSGVQFRAISEGSWERLAATSSEIDVKVDPLLTLRGPALSLIGRMETLTATLTPASSSNGQSPTILLERFDEKKGAFAEIARARVDGQGVATFTLRMPTSSTSSRAPFFSTLRARLLVKNQTAKNQTGKNQTGTSQSPSSLEALVSSTLSVTTLRP